MRFRTFTVVLILLLLAMAAASALAISLEDREHQRDLPASSLELVVIDPQTGLPLELPGPEGQPVMASPNLVPWGAIVLANPVVDLGERRLDRVEVRLDMVVMAVIKKPPFTYDIETRGLRPGISHTVQVLVIRRDGRYTSAVNTFFLSPVPLETYFPKEAAQETAISERAPEKSVELPKPARDITLSCPYTGHARVELNQQLEARDPQGQVIGILHVTKLNPDGFLARLVAGDAPNGAALYPVKEENHVA